MPIPQAPPIHAGPPPPPSPSAWPVALGIILIIICTFAVLTALAQLTSPLWWPVDVQLDPSSDPIKDFSPFGPPVYAYIFGATSLLLALLGIYAGIILCKRRPASPRLCTLWSILDILNVLIANAIMLTVMPAFPPASNPSEQAIQNIATILGGACGILIALALPVFLLIWFARRKIRAQVAHWA